ncbi:MAG: flagellar hook-associated protein FlgK [Defluviitaleaceae bacterium]|nr:flagellar hook-associated protein FlgK [Defluviitaleaceae bacterium]
MRASFFGFHVTTTGLNSARNATYVSAHNVANMNTAGFSRQQAVIRAATPLNTRSSWGMLGTGSEMTGINQIRDVHLDNRFRSESAILGRQHALTRGLTMSQAIFASFEGSSQNNYFNNFFNSIQTLSTNPTDPALRQNFLQSGDNLSRLIQTQAAALRSQQLDINAEIRTTVQQINILGEQLTRVNEQIERAEINGGRANDLRDRRALLLDELSELVNIQKEEVNFNGRNRLLVHIDGQLFVNHDSFNRLDLERREYPLNDGDAPGLYTIVFDHGTIRVPFNYQNSRTLSGQLAGLLQVRDGNSTLQTTGPYAGRSYSPIAFRGVPYYKMRLNNLIRGFANAVNNGTDHLGNPIEGLGEGHIGNLRADGTLSGIPLFVPVGADGMPILIDDPADPNYGEIDLDAINIFNFAVNPEIRSNPSLIATHFGTASSGESANNFLLGLASLQNNRNLFPEGGISDVIATIMAELGGDLLRAETFHETQESIVEIIHEQRLSIKGVSYNEEVASLTLFQAQFVALSRILTVIDGIYDVMINRMGLG